MNGSLSTDTFILSIILSLGIIGPLITTYQYLRVSHKEETGKRIGESPCKNE